MKVVGVDPGYDRLGVAVLEHTDGNDTLLYSTCIETDKNATLPERLLTLGQEFGRILEEYTPGRVGIETLFFNKNQKTAIGVAAARGVVMYLAKEHACEVVEYSPQQVKIAVTGYGKSDKRAVTDMTRRLVRNVPEKALDDEYDAIAVGVAALAPTPTF